MSFGSSTVQTFNLRLVSFIRFASAGFFRKSEIPGPNDWADE
jgi:hypothetical protein